MSRNNAIGYARGAAGKHGVGTTKNIPRVDDHMPLGARIGSTIKLQAAPFIRAACEGSLITPPEASGMQIHAISSVQVDITGRLFRFFLQASGSDAQQRFLQVFSDGNGAISETLYCTRLTRVIPETEEDQDVFMGLSGCGLGEKTFTLWREQIRDLGATDADLALIFGERDSLEYRREAGDPSAEFIKPFTGTEMRVDDAYGHNGLQQQIYFMPYVRDLPSGREYLLITTEIVKSRGSDNSRRNIQVDFMIGIPIEEQERILMMHLSKNASTATAA